MTRNDFGTWQEEVLRQVRFAPDRRSIGKELTAHYEDHRDALLECGYPKQEAEARALEALGDAKEVGAALNRVHKYWLGVLWTVSRWAAVALALALPLTVALNWDRYDGTILWTRTKAELTYEAPPVWAARTETPAGTVYLAPSSETMEGARGQTLYLADLWVEGDRVLSPSWVSVLQLYDQTGNITRDLPLSDLEQPDESEAWVEFPDEEHLGWRRMKLRIALATPQPPAYLIVRQIHGEAPWELRCDWEGRS